MKTAKNRGIARRAGLGSLVAGTLLAATGLVASPASAAVADHQVEMCHATSAGSNPYSSISPNKWQIMSPNGHGLDAGDVIPPFAAGSHGTHTWAAYPGSASWADGGSALLANGCNEAPAPLGSITLDKLTAGDDQPAGDTGFTFTVACDEGVMVPSGSPVVTPDAPALVVASGLDGDDSCVISEIADGGAVSTSVKVGAGTEQDDTGSVEVNAGDQGAAVAVVFTNTFACDAGDIPDGDGGCTTPVDVCADVAGPQTDPALCPADVVEVVVVPVVVPLAPPAPPAPPVAPAAPVASEVGGVIVAAAELPRTGSEEQTLALIGFGLVLVGVGAVLAGREHALEV
ncbi:MAG: LPXTG cell wall anchor domain-containing protein [Acidimicrobiales bacterium]